MVDSILDEVWLANIVICEKSSSIFLNGLGVLPPILRYIFLITVSSMPDGSYSSDGSSTRLLNLPVVPSNTMLNLPGSPKFGLPSSTLSTVPTLLNSCLSLERVAPQPVVVYSMLPSSFFSALYIMDLPSLRISLSSIL